MSLWMNVIQKLWPEICDCHPFRWMLPPRRAWFYEGFCASLFPLAFALSLAFSTKWFFPGSSQCEEIAEIWAIEWERARDWEAAEESSTRNSQNTTISKPEGSFAFLWGFLLLEFGHATLFQCKGFNTAVVFFCHSNCGERELLQVSCMIETVSTWYWRTALPAQL